MKKKYFILILQLFGFSVFGQLDSDFLKAKKQADDCFVRGDYACAKKQYEIALAINVNDSYCKERLQNAKKREIQKKIKQEDEFYEKQRLEQERLDNEKKQTEEQSKNEIEIALTNYFSKKDLQNSFKTLYKYRFESFFSDKASYTLGMMYKTGVGVSKNAEEAYQFFLKGSSYLDAQFELGEANHFGVGTSNHFGTAVSWYTKAANNGHTEAQYRLARMYFYGTGTAQDNEKAFFWFYTAAVKGHTEAAYEYAKMRYDVESFRDYAEAFKWYSVAANAKHPAAQIELAKLYYYGIGVEKDYEKALYWFYQSKEVWRESKCFLGYMYYYGKGTSINYQEAYNYCSATSYNIDSQLILAKLHFYESIEIEKDSSVFWLNKAIASGSEEAKKILMIKGVVKDQKELTPLAGCTVAIKGTMKGTQTNIDGKFRFMLEGDDVTLIFSFIGYNTIEYSINKSHTGIIVEMPEGRKNKIIVKKIDE